MKRKNFKTQRNMFSTLEVKNIKKLAENETNLTEKVKKIMNI